MEKFDRPATFGEENRAMHPTAKTGASIIPKAAREHQVVLITPEGETCLVVSEEEFILDACRKAGLSLPSTCLQGWCLTCSARLLEGEVDQSDALRYYQEDRDAGFIPLCSAKPRSAIRVQTHAKKAMQRHRLEKNLPTPKA